MEILFKPVASASHSPSSLTALMQLWQHPPFASSPAALFDLTPQQPETALAHLLNAGPNLTWIRQIQTGRYVFMSRHTQQLLGYDPLALKEKGIKLMHELLHPDDAKPYWQLMLQVWQYLAALPPDQRPHYQFNS